jgi:thiol:disulfide interchange protein
MKKKSIDWVFFAVIGVVFVGLLVWFSRPAPADGIAWHASLAEARAAASETGRPVFIKFTAEWCGPCQMMDRETFPAPQVGEALAAYEPVKVDGDRNPELMQEYGVRAYPTLMVLSPAGQVQKRVEGAMRPEQLVRFLAGA